MEEAKPAMGTNYQKVVSTPASVISNLRLTRNTFLIASASRKLSALSKPVNVLVLTGVMTLAAYTSMRMGINSCTKRPTTAGLERNSSVLSGGASFAGVAFEVDAPSSASCEVRSTTGVGVDASLSAAGVAAASTGAEGAGVDADAEV